MNQNSLTIFVKNRYCDVKCNVMSVSARTCNYTLKITESAMDMRGIDLSYQVQLL